MSFAELKTPSSPNDPDSRASLPTDTDLTSSTERDTGRLAVAVVVPFLNEQTHLPTFLRSIDLQTRRPDQLVLVDDGSTDGSFEVAAEFAAGRPYVVALRRPPRPSAGDRLAKAAELEAFVWGLSQVEIPYDVAAKLDADLDLSPRHVAEVLSQLEDDPSTGLVGAYLSVRNPAGAIVRERHATHHIRGATKFYRRACLEQIWPLSDHLGWDTIDETAARMHGWTTVSIELSGGDTLHLRPTGAFDGRLRAFWRWGASAYAYGSHPLHVAGVGLTRSTWRPYGISGISYMVGWASWNVRRRPRAPAPVRAFRRREDLRRIRGKLRRITHHN